MFRRLAFENAVALLALLLTLVGAGLAIFGPATFTYGTNWLTAGATSVWSYGVDSNVAIYVAAMVVAGLLVAVGAYTRSADIGGALLILWTGVLILAVGALIAVPGSTNAVLPAGLHTDTPDSVGIGIYMMPATLIAALAGLAGSAVHHHPGRPVAFGPR